MALIVCWRNGKVDLSRRVPKGSMKVLSGHGRRLRRVPRLCAVMNDDGKIFVLPTLKEASSDQAAIEAVEAFVAQLRATLALGPHRRFRGGRLL